MEARKQALSEEISKKIERKRHSKASMQLFYHLRRSRVKRRQFPLALMVAARGAEYMSDSSPKAAEPSYMCT